MHITSKDHDFDKHKFTLSEVALIEVTDYFMHMVFKIEKKTTLI